MALSRCEKPQPAALAFSNPLDTIADHEFIIDTHLKYWGRVGTQGLERVNPAAYIAATGMINRIGDAVASTYVLSGDTSEEGEAIRETCRRNAMGTAGFTLLFRRIVKNINDVSDGIRADSINMLLDVDSDESGGYAEDRMHVSSEVAAQILPPPAEESDEWFYDGKLYVHQQTPAADHVRDRVKLYAMEHGTDISASLPGLITLSGFLPSKYVEHPNA